MKVIWSLVIVLVAGTYYSCNDNNSELELERLTYEGDLVGYWLLYEQGYSPGAGYKIKEVPSRPAKLIQFRRNLTFFSNIAGLADFTHYRVIEDHTAPFRKIVALFKSEPTESDLTQLNTSFYVSFIDSNLKLSYRWCIEGCHMGFRPY